MCLTVLINVTVKSHGIEPRLTHSTFSLDEYVVVRTIYGPYYHEYTDSFMISCQG